MSVGRVLKAAGVGALVLVGLFLLWVIFFGATTEGGECSFEEVECSALGEFVDSDTFVALSLPVLAVVALAVGWLLTRPKSP